MTFHDIPDLTREEKTAIVQKALEMLGEVFEVVQIMVSEPNPEGGTGFMYKGSGNWFARHGMAHDFIRQEVSKSHAEALSVVLPKPPEDGENWKQS